MTNNSLLQQRLQRQLISGHLFQKPEEIVAWFGAMQAQDYAACKWGIGVRLPGATDASIEEAFAAKKIIRTWGQRGTLHIMAPQDVRWMLQLFTPRLYTAYAGHFRRLELDAGVLKKSNNAIARILEGKQLTRKELMFLLEKKGINTTGLRANFLMVRAAWDGILCLGLKRAKEFTYTSLDDFAPISKTLTREEAGAELARRYFLSHSPATLQDFTWWSGLNVVDAKKALENSKHELTAEVFKGQTYWMPQKQLTPQAISGTYMLPAFDEYLISYRDRNNATSECREKNIIFTNNGIFNPIIIEKGMVKGTWKRSFKKNGVSIEATTFKPLSTSQKKAITKAVNEFGKFLGMPAPTLNTAQLI